MRRHCRRQCGGAAGLSSSNIPAALKLALGCDRTRRNSWRRGPPCGREKSLDVRVGYRLVAHAALQIGVRILLQNPEHRPMARRVAAAAAVLPASPAALA